MTEPNHPPEVVRIDRMRMYELLWVKLNQEGDGIWSRFNILVGLNVALFAGFAFFFASDQPHPLWREFSGGIALLGILISAWSLVVLKGLWAWHRHWKGQLKAIEARFPESDRWLSPHSRLPDGLPLWRGAPGSTQPVFFMLTIVWAVLLGVVIAHAR